MKTITLAAPVCALAVAAAGEAQTLFTTDDYRGDREHWTDPAYYDYNTARELTGMQVDARYGERGSGDDEYTLASPYPYRSADEHFQAWMDEADGGTTHSFETLPDWSGLWAGGSTWLDSRRVQAGTVAAVLTPQYREYYVQQVKADAEGRHWWAAAYCLPDGFVRYELIDGRLVGEVTLYDSNVFVVPLHARLEFSPFDLPDFRLSYDTCTDTNGPSSKIFVDEAGRIDQRGPGDPAYWDPNEARPWARQFAIGE